MLSIVAHGHDAVQITGEVIEAGSEVEYVQVGDLVSAPFNIACGAII